MDNTSDLQTVPMRPNEIPLFPLDLVLFPHMVLPLHIFEERYREMVNRCLRDGTPFGIVRATSVEPGTGRVQTAPVGCLARILRAERLDDGRINIEIHGEGRFRILDTHEQNSYRTGLIEPFVDEPTDEAEPLTEEAANLLREFLTRSLALMGREAGEFGLPDEPEQLSFTAACVLPIEDDQKQTLLETRDTVTRLATVRDVLRREIARLGEASPPAPVEWKRVAPDAYTAFHCPN